MTRMSFSAFLFRALRYGLITVLVLVALIAAAIGYLGFTARGNQFLADQVAALIETDDLHVQISGLRGLLDGEMFADKVTIADSLGPYAEIDALQLGWRPQELLKARFHADRLSAARVSVARAPITTIESQDDSGSTGLPLEVAIDKIALPEIALAAPLAGRAALLSLEGSGRAIETQISLNLSARERQSSQAAADARIDYRLDRNTLAADIRLTEPEGGILATLLQLPGRPKVSIAVKGAGPLDNWQGAITGAVADKQVVNLKGALATAPNGLRQVSLQGSGQFAELMPPQIRPLLTGDTKIDIAARQAANGRIEIDRGAIANDLYRLSASGTLDPRASAALTVELTPAGDTLDLALPLNDGVVDARIGGVALKLSGPFNAAALSASADIRSLKTPYGALTGAVVTADSAAIDLAARTGSVSFKAQLSELALDDPSAAQLLRGPLTMTGVANLTTGAIQLDKGHIDSPSLKGDLAGAYDLATGTANAKLALDAALEPLAPPALRPALSGMTQLSAELEKDSASRLSLNALTVNAKGLDLTGSAALDGEALTGALDLDVKDASRLDARAAGQAKATVSLSGALSRPEAKIALTSQSLAFNGQALETIEATIAALKDGETASATVSAKASYRDKPLTLDAAASLKKGGVSVRDLKAQLGQNAITGAVALNADNQPEGTFRFDLPDLATLASLAGQKAEGALKGEAKLTSVNGRTALTVNAEGQRLANDAATLLSPRLTLIMDDIATLSLRAQLQALEVSAANIHILRPALYVNYGGEQARFDLATELDQAPMTLTGSAKLGNGPILVTLDKFAASPRQIAMSLAKPTTITVADGGARLEDLTLAFGKGRLAVSGFAGAELDLDARFDNLPLDVANHFAPEIALGGALTGAATIKGRAADPHIAFTVTAADLVTAQTKSAKLPPLTVQAAGRYASKAAHIDAVTTLRNEKVELAGNVRLLDEAGFGVDNIKLKAAGAAISGAVSLDTAFRPTGSVDFDIPDSKRLAAMVGQTAEGAFKGKASIKPADKGLEISVAADGVVRKQPLKLTTRIDSVVGTFSLPEFTMTLGPNTVAGAVSLNEALLPTGKIRFDLPDVGLLAALAGKTAEGSLKGDADITAQNGRVAADVTARGALRGQQIDIAIKGAQTAQGISIPSLNAMIGKNRINGALELDKTYRPEGRFSFDLPDLALLGALAGQKIEGAASGDATLTSKDGPMRGTIRAAAARVAGFGAEINGLSADLAIADAARGQVSGSVKAARIASGANAVANLALTFDRQGEATGLKLAAVYDGKPATAAGTLTPDADGMTLALDTASAQPRGVPVKLTAPTKIRIAKGAAAVDTLKLALGAGSVTASGSVGAGQVGLEARINALPASLTNIVSPGLDAAGVINGTVSAKGGAASPALGFALDWSGAQTAQTRAAGLGAFKISAKGETKGGQLSIDVKADGGGGLSAAAKGTVGMSGGNPLALKIDGKLPFDALAGLTAPQGIDVRGNATMQLSITGAAKSPVITGRISTLGAQVTVIRQNLTIRGIAATIELDGKQARIANLSGQFASGGTIKIGGTIGIAPGSGYPANLTIALDRAVYTDARIVVAKLSGNLTLTGSLIAQPALGGRINVSRADITIPERLPGSLGKLNIRHVNAPPAIIEQKKAITANRGDASKNEESKAGGVSLDLTIAAPRQIFVRGRGLDAELGGTVQVAGDSGNPRVTGGFKMRRGRLSIIGRRLDFASGTISFAGGLMPTLDMVATSTVNGTTVSVTVSGVASDPKVTFSSSPALPQDEILAQLIFGRSAANLSAVQIAQLADAVATLAGGQSSSLFDKLRQGLGVDDLDIGTDANGNTALSVGKYINKRTYLQFQQGSDSSSTRAIINLDVGKGVKLKGSAGADGSTGGGVFYEKEY